MVKMAEASTPQTGKSLTSFILSFLYTFIKVQIIIVLLFPQRRRLIRFYKQIFDNTIVILTYLSTIVTAFITNAYRIIMPRHQQQQQQQQQPQPETETPAPPKDWAEEITKSLEILIQTFGVFEIAADGINGGREDKQLAKKKDSDLFNIAEQVEDLLGHIVKLLVDAPRVEKKFAGAGLVLSEQIAAAVKGFVAKQQIYTSNKTDQILFAIICALTKSYGKLMLALQYKSGVEERKALKAEYLVVRTVFVDFVKSYAPDVADKMTEGMGL